VINAKSEVPLKFGFQLSLKQNASYRTEFKTEVKAKLQC